MKLIFDNKSKPIYDRIYLTLGKKTKKVFDLELKKEIDLIEEAEVDVGALMRVCKMISIPFKKFVILPDLL